jgi:hypothetical protein
VSSLSLSFFFELGKLANEKPERCVAFNLDFYTEVQDLNHLLPLLSQDPRMGKFGELNEKIIELVEEFGLVSFETLAVEVRSLSRSDST